MDKITESLKTYRGKESNNRAVVLMREIDEIFIKMAWNHRFIRTGMATIAL